MGIFGPTRSIVRDYDAAIAFFVDILGFDLAEDSPAVTNDGRSKRWVVVRPPGAKTGVLLARADGEEQQAAVGHQAAGRVGFYLRVDDLDATYQRLLATACRSSASLVTSRTAVAASSSVSAGIVGLRLRGG